MVMFRYFNIYTGGIGPLGYPAIKGSVRRSPMKELDLGEGVDLRKPNFVDIRIKTG